APDPGPALTRAVPTFIPKPASGLALPGLFRATVVVTDDGQGIADDVIALLHQVGATAVHTDEILTAPPADVSATIFLGGLRPDPAAHADSYPFAADVAITREAFHVARSVAGTGAFVTVGRLGRTGLGALTRTCAREWPDVAVKSIELDQPDAASAAVAIVTELLTGDSEPDIVLGPDGSRSAWTMQPASLPAASEATAPLSAESVVIITGGARGVTAACARALAHAFRCRIALVGRTPLTDEPPDLGDAQSEVDLRAALVGRAVRAGERPRPAAIESELRRVLAVREVRSTLADIEAAGSAVRYLRADVGDIESLSGALDEVRAEWGAVTGVVHGAGVLADRLVVDKTDEQFDRVLRVKAEGFRNLLELVGADEPALVAVFSSVAASAGNSGQCDYAAANEIAERLAVDWRARHPACVVKAIAWGPWSGGMVGADLAAMFAERDVALIALAAGAEAFVAEITGPIGAERTHDGPQVGDGMPADDVGADDVGADDVPADEVRADGVRCLIAAGTSGAPSAPREGDLAVSEVAQVWLGSHRIGDRAVVPLAVVCDWMLRLIDVDVDGAGSVTASAPALVLRDIDVVRGIVAPSVVTVRRVGAEFTVVTAAGVRCYRCL
ncbi:SDR family NAD(P)-dependent oxidoreductase, partial [Actinospica durhamensis]